MFRFILMMCFASLGCSTAPIAGFLDWVSPSRPKDYFPNLREAGDLPIREPSPENNNPPKMRTENLPKDALPDLNQSSQGLPEPDSISRKRASERIAEPKKASDDRPIR